MPNKHPNQEALKDLLPLVGKARTVFAQIVANWHKDKKFSMIKARTTLEKALTQFSMRFKYDYQKLLDKAMNTQRSTQFMRSAGVML